MTDTDEASGENPFSSARGLILTEQNAASYEPDWLLIEEDGPEGTVTRRVPGCVVVQG